MSSGRVSFWTIQWRQHSAKMEVILGFVRVITCKHAESDVFCQQNCNPVDFPELAGEERKGQYFNSSIAEQTNVWLGGYHAICREMLPDKYDFFLDEMILQRNRMTRDKLQKDGKGPSTWPKV